MRKLQGRFTETNLWDRDVRETLRSAPVLNMEEFSKRAGEVPDEVEQVLKTEPEEAPAA